MATLSYDGWQLFQVTRFAKLFKSQDAATGAIAVVKSISKHDFIPPHDPIHELHILQKVSKLDTPNIIRLLKYEEGVLKDNDGFGDDNELRFYFIYYPLNLFEFMLQNYKYVTEKKKFNPYYDMPTNVHGTRDTNTYEMANDLDVNKFVLPFFKALANGLHFLHSNSIIHRDIKPQNILLSDDFIPVITDFGISYDISNSTKIAKEPLDHKITDVSTSIYKAPELLLGVRNYSYAVDIWSLLVLLSQWLQNTTITVHKEQKQHRTLPAMVDDGASDPMESDGSDIRLMLSIFQNFGIPSAEEWPEVINHGSKDAFEGMFGTKGDGNYIKLKAIEQQKDTILQVMPRLNDIVDTYSRERIIDCILGMLSFESTKRWTSAQIVEHISCL